MLPEATWIPELFVELSAPPISAEQLVSVMMFPPLALKLLSVVTQDGARALRPAIATACAAAVGLPSSPIKNDFHSALAVAWAQSCWAVEFGQATG
jgi:hypothetical protein